MTTPNPMDNNNNPEDPLNPGQRQMGPGKRQRRPGRRRRKRPTSTEPTLNGVEDGPSFLDSTSRPIPGEPNYEFRVSGEDTRETTIRTEKTTSRVPQQGSNYKQNRKPYSMTRKDSEAEPSNSDSRSDLKSLLKQAGGGLSLSEVLQQKNISLADLLNKKQHALAVLANSESSTTARIDLNSGEMMMTGEDDKEMKKPRRVPMFVAMPPHVYPTEELRPPPPQAPAPTIALATDVHSHKRIPVVGPNVHSKPIKEVVSRIRPDFSNSKRTTTEGNSNATTPSRPSR